MDKNNVDTAKELPTVISFCSGYGGIERGLDLARVKHQVLAYVEIEAFAIANLVAKMETGQLVPAPIFTDLKTFPAHLFRGCVDIITGGYPCQPFSAAGKRLGTEDPRHLWPYILNHIKAIRPVRCMFENVEGHISLGLREVIGDLEGAGYNATWGIFSAAEVGAPHQRKRVYIMANAGSRRLSGASEWQDQQQRGAEIVGAGKVVADTNYSGQQQGNQKNQEQSPEQPDSHCIQPGNATNTDRTGLERGLLDNGIDSQRRQVESDGRPAERCDWGAWYRRGVWAPEPGLGRVVDGCPNRVDRLRLLGNGVVPQTSAKAWEILSSRLQIS